MKYEHVDHMVTRDLIFKDRESQTAEAHFTNIALIPTWMNNYIHYKMCAEISYPFPNFNGATEEVWVWISIK